MTRFTLLALVSLAACGDEPSPALDATTDATAVPATWEADVRLTDAAGASQTTYNFARDIAITSDGALHAAWFDTRDGHAQIYTARSRDGGTTWDPAVRVAPTADSQQHAAIAASGTTVYLAWHEVQAGMFHVYLARSDDAGTTWSTARKMSTTGKSAHPSLAADGDRIHVVFADTDASTEIMYLSSSDRGATWGVPVQLSPPQHESWVGGVATSGTRVVVSWVDYRDANEEEYLRISSDGGTTWDAARRMTEDAADSWAPSVAIAGDTIHFAWFDRRDTLYDDGDVEEYVDDLGEIVGLSLEPAPPRTPDRYYLWDFEARLDTKVAAIQAAIPAYIERGGDPAVVMVAFDEYMRRRAAWSFGWEIYYKRSTDGGVTFGPDTRLTNAPHLSQRPSIAAVGDRVDLVWFDGRDGDPSNQDELEIYAASSRDGGVTWAQDERLTSAAGTSLFPSLAATADRLHVVWFDSRDGQDEIYYKRQLR